MGSAVLAVARPSVCCGESGQAQLRHPVCVCVPLRPHSTVMTLIHAPGFHVVPHEHAGGEGRCCASLGCPEGNVGVARIGCACSSFASVAPITSPSHSTFHSGVPWVVAARSPLLLVLRRLRRAGLQPPRSRVHWSVPPPPHRLLSHRIRPLFSNLTLVAPYPALLWPMVGRTTASLPLCGLNSRRRWRLAWPPSSISCGRPRGHWSRSRPATRLPWCASACGLAVGCSGMRRDAVGCSGMQWDAVG
jgi:hypothetical protein